MHANTGAKVGPRRLLPFFLSASLVFVVSCGQSDESGDEQVEDESQSLTRNGVIKRSEIMARAANWANNPREYDMYSTDSSGYRKDCSGYVSMAWYLSTPGLSTVTLPNVSHRISKSELKAGDVLMKGGAGTGGANGHVIIFEKWANAAQTQYWAYEQTPPQTVHRIKYYDEYEYPPYRYNNVQDDDGSTSNNNGNNGTSSTCGVRSDGKLSCANTGGAALYSNRSTASSVVNHLRTTTSWFQCWGYGDLHSGGNHTWYYTLGDDNGNWGWVPAANLNTSSSFDANPSASGLARCNAAAPTSGCSVATDGRLYCGNKGGAALYRSANNSSGVANYLRSTFSWFSCWDYGAYHAGGNSTWYYTQGDDNGNWGWIPAVNMSTTSAFDSNPSTQGLRRCGR